MKKNKLITLLSVLVLFSSNSTGLVVLAEELGTSLAQPLEAAESDLQGASPAEANLVEDTGAVMVEPVQAEVAEDNGEITAEPAVAVENATDTTDSTASESEEPSPSTETTPSETGETKSPNTEDTSTTVEEPSKQTEDAPENQTDSGTEQSPGFPSVLVTNPSTSTGNTTSDNSSADMTLDDYTSFNVSYYVDHWSGDDAYSHNLLSHRYGITAEQLDGYLNSTGIAYNKERINGVKLLEWEKASGLDVRAIVAIAIAESSLGTAGVATMDGANMFGYGAFDSNPNNATRYNDQTAVTALTKVTIIQHKNQTFKIQDQKAQRYAAGLLNAVVDGGVYYTDTSGTGKRRAEIMEAIDEWVDEHGGTPEIPEELKVLTTASMTNLPDGYSTSSPADVSSYIASTYPWGQCTWFVYNRARELGYSFGPFMGNGADWQHQAGYETTHKPEVGYAVSFSPGQAGADGTYGHVAIVEEVREDGSVLISESNAVGLGVVSYRTFSAAQASQLTYVIGHK